MNASSAAGALLKVDALKFVTTQAKMVQIGGRGPAVGGGYGGLGVGRRCQEKNRQGAEGRGRWRPRVAMLLLASWLRVFGNQVHGLG